jgi:uncharacterized membrane protein YdjX (TVP38/TMEM64 family)
VAPAPPLDLAVLDGAMVDPPEPWNADLLLDRAVPVSLRRRLARRWLRPVAVAAAALAVWALLRHLDPHALRLRAVASHAARWMAAEPAGPFLAVATFALCTVVFVPVTLLATVTLTVFGGWPGVPIAWAASVLGATASHALGARLGEPAVRWIPARIGGNLRRFLDRHAFWSVVFIRLMPLGNFGALNLLAGAMKVPRRSFVLGNAVGLLPGLVGLGVLVNRALAAVRHPTLANVLLALAILILAIGAGVGLKRRFRVPAAAAAAAIARSRGP